MKIRDGSLSRLSVQRTPKHIYAQITSPKGDRTLVSASTLETSIRSGATGNKNAASEVGKLIAERAISLELRTFLLIEVDINIMEESKHWQILREK